ncbi:unnamed protein product [Darwinula stevensoni]|uniref:Uncharacterized protein n=1 Tax=Darwinula stevensoni TaxID=69355 RepID=A0A7R9AFW3_9CRUS|nr:unnamed protein product [Darwinula stevensoni]CAG0903392.1 unnamed protein product [Darwinula stevensoni]
MILIVNYSEPEKEQDIFSHEISRSAAGQIGPEGHRSSTLVVDGPSSLKRASFAVEGGGGGASHFSFHEQPYCRSIPVMAERSPTTSRPKDSSMDHPTSSAKYAVFSFTKKWIYFTSRDKSIIVMVSENMSDGGHPLKIKGNKEEYPGNKAAKPHKNPSNIELEFDGRMDTVAFPVTRICTKTKITKLIIGEYMKERTISCLVQGINLMISNVRDGIECESGQRQGDGSHRINAIMIQTQAYHGILRLLNRDQNCSPLKTTREVCGKGLGWQRAPNSGGRKRKRHQVKQF